MTNQQGFNLSVQERIARTEEKVETLDERVDAHDSELKVLTSQLNALVIEIKSVKNALYVVALAVSANIPALKTLASTLSKYFLGL